MRPYPCGLFRSSVVSVVVKPRVALAPTIPSQAKELQKRDINYIVRKGEVIIVDEFTGRTMAGRRWGDGLHQAVEAKEGVPIQNETITLASISYQSFFLSYPKLSGMTGAIWHNTAGLRKPCWSVRHRRGSTDIGTGGLKQTQE